GLMILAAACASASGEHRQHSWKNWIQMIPLGLLAAYGIAAVRKIYIADFVDSPELWGLTANATAGGLLGTMGIMCLGFWAARRPWGARAYIMVFLPLALGVSTYNTTKELRQRLHPDVYDDAGVFAHLYPGEDASNLIVASSNLAGLFKVLFHV